jgi:hypothetical protein
MLRQGVFFWPFPLDIDPLDIEPLDVELLDCEIASNSDPFQRSSMPLISRVNP